MVNGVAAAKAIWSIQWRAYKVFGDERAISFFFVAAPEDLQANAE